MRTIDADELSKKLFDVVDKYDSGEYLTFDNGKFAFGNDIENETREVLTLNEAVQAAINDMPTIK